MDNFILKDHLCHDAYSWPQTMLTYHCEGETPVPGKDCLLQDGRPVPWQAEPEANGGYALKLISDLPTGGEHRFVWKKSARTVQTPLAKEGMDNGIYRCSSANGLFSAVCRNGTEIVFSLLTDARIAEERETAEGGPVEKIYRKTVRFEGGGVYRLCIKLRHGLDFLEVYEDMRGLGEISASLQVRWNGFVPRYRHTLDRGTEKIKAYLREDGSFPFDINPFMPRISWWDQRSVAYLDGAKKNWFGILLHDLSSFDDGGYAVWGSRGKLAVRAYPNRLEAPVAEGSRAFLVVCGEDGAPARLVSHYQKYYSHVPLDKVKDWVLDWEDDKAGYPKYFRASEETRADYWYFHRTGMPAPEDMLRVLDCESSIFRQPELIKPVSCRAYIYSWAPLFDMTASRMSDAQFRRVRAALAMTCYILSGENYYPTRNMLGGHPNFLADVAGAVGIFAALLGKKHPAFREWMEYYERAMALNMKYHIRPDVPQWGAAGGRWTENVGCYMFGMLNCCAWVCSVIYRTCGEMPLLGRRFTALLRFLTEIQMPENAAGRRLYLPQGAHSATGEFGGDLGHGYMLGMLQLADMCRFYEPVYAEYLLHNFRRAADFAALTAPESLAGASYRPYAQNDGGTAPDLRSEKFTGYGFMLRSAVNTEDETAVFLQQIDEGPNYRWGRAAQGGCGELYYYAARRSLTWHAPEDVGDENRGDVQSCTNFGVLTGHEYRSVGRGDLTEPLLDFGFVQYARVNAGEYSQPYYRYRSVMLVSNEYIAVYDAVCDAMQSGRFVWAQRSEEEFPKIWNIRPGVQYFSADSGVPVDAGPGYRPQYGACRTHVYDGQGDFFTIVTHLRDYNDEPLIFAPVRREYGCEIAFPGYTDNVFDEQAEGEYEEDGCVFAGKVGYVRRMPGKTFLAVFDGEKIGAGGIALQIPREEGVRRAMSLAFAGGEACGRAVFEKAGTVSVRMPEAKDLRVWAGEAEVPFRYMAGAYTFEMPAGSVCWNIGSRQKIGRARIESVCVCAGGFTLRGAPCAGAETLRAEISADGGRSFRPAGECPAESRVLQVCGLADGKYHVRLCGAAARRAGEYSALYPVYVTGSVPHWPEGLRIEAEGDGFRVSWGGVLGADRYSLYRTDGPEPVPVYSGEERTYFVKEGAYSVTASNGNGESAASPERSCSGALAHWDAHPEVPFVRDTRSHEHGYKGFPFIENKEKPVLTYPKE